MAALVCPREPPPAAAGPLEALFALAVVWRYSCTAAGFSTTARFSFEVVLLQFELLAVILL